MCYSRVNTTALLANTSHCQAMPYQPEALARNSVENLAGASGWYRDTSNCWDHVALLNYSSGACFPVRRLQDRMAAAIRPKPMGKADSMVAMFTMILRASFTAHSVSSSRE